eukprot:2106369-Rhodomonas_salina.1
MMWQIRATKWEKELRKKPDTFTWMRLKQSILEAADMIKKRATTVDSPQQEAGPRRRIEPSLPN